MTDIAVSILHRGVLHRGVAGDPRAGAEWGTGAGKDSEEHRGVGRFGAKDTCLSLPAVRLVAKIRRSGDGDPELLG